MFNNKRFLHQKGVVVCIIVMGIITSFMACKSKHNDEVEQQATEETTEPVYATIISEMETHGDTYIVELSDYVINQQASVLLGYPKAVEIKFPETKGRLIYDSPINVLEKNSLVTEGDELAICHMEYEFYEIEKTRLLAEELQEAYRITEKEFVTQKEDELKAIKKMPNGKEKDTLLADYYERYEQDKEVLDEQKVNADEVSETYQYYMEWNNKEFAITADKTGIVVQFNHYEAGEDVTDEYIAWVFDDKEEIAIMAEAMIPYGAKVTLRNFDTGETYEGEVASGNKFLNVDMVKEVSYIRVEEMTFQQLFEKKFVVEYQKTIENVLLIPQSCVIYDKGQSYILKENDDGIVMKEAVTVLVQNRENGVAWLLDGVSEGDVLRYNAEEMD